MLPPITFRAVVWPETALGTNGGSLNNSEIELQNVEFRRFLVGQAPPYLIFGGMTRSMFFALLPPVARVGSVGLVLVGLRIWLVLLFLCLTCRHFLLGDTSMIRRAV